MDERTLKALVTAGAIRNVTIIASGARFHVEARTPNGGITAETQKGKVKTWVTLDAAARWVRSVGIGDVKVNLTHWQPGQREMTIRGSAKAPTAPERHREPAEDQGELFSRPCVA